MEGKSENAESRRWKGQARNLIIDAIDLRLSVAARDTVRARAVVFARRVRRRGTRIAFAEKGAERQRMRLRARGDSRNASDLQQYRNEKNDPNEHGLPPTIAYGARIIGAKQSCGNTETLYTTRAWRNDKGREGQGALTNGKGRRACFTVSCRHSIFIAVRAQPAVARAIWIDVGAQGVFAPVN